MKKFLLSISFVSIALLSGFSQGIELKDKDGNDITNGTLAVHGSPSSSAIKAEVFLHNGMEESMLVWAKKIEIEVLPDTYNSFCWANHCYTPSVFDSETGITLAAGETSNATDFYGEYYPEGNAGSTIIKYEFFSRNESFETVSVTVTYTADVTSSVPLRLNQVMFSDPRPNPARDFALFDYQLPSGTNSARLVVRSLTGLVVMEIPIDVMGSRLRLETSGLKNGIYLYTLEVNERVITTKKLVVNR